MALYHLRTLGGLVLSRTGEPAGEIALADSKALLLLAYLATKPGYTARRVDVAELFWPQGSRARALRALRQALFFLSRHAGGALLRDDTSVTLDAGAVTVDVWELEEAVERESHARVIELYTGRFAAGLERKVGIELEHWIEAMDARLAVGIEVAYAREIPQALARGDAARATQLARAFALLNPLDETRQELLATTLASAGDRLGALQALEQYRRGVAPGLGDEPSPDLDARVGIMRQELLRTAEPWGAAAAAPAAVPRSAGPAAFTVRGHPVTGTALIGGGAVAVAAIAGILLLTRARTPAVDPFADLNARLLAVVDRGGEEKVAELTLQPAGVTASERDDLRPTDLPSIDGGAVAMVLQAPDGWNLATRTGSGDPRALTAMPGDEYPLDWSPDARYLLYGHRELLADGRTESNRIYVFDLQADTGWTLAALTSRERPAAAWSPDGTHIAFTADVRGAAEVFVVRFDGTDLRDVSRSPGWDGEPAWSPDHERLAFVSRRSGHTEVYLARADGGEIRRLTQSRWEKHHPLWISPMVLAFEVERDGARSLDVLNTFSGQSRDLGGPDGLRAIVAVRQRPLPWIAKVAITPRTELASPGQHVTYGLDVRSSDDTPLVAEGIPVQWTVTDRRVARVESAGRVRVVGPGRTDVVASAAGWRADTLTLFSLPLVAVATTPVFVESWRSEPDSGRWRPFGEPLPTIGRSGGPRNGGVFLNNGDAFFASGAVTRQRFTLKDGISVQVGGRAPFSGRPHQEFGLALYPQDYPDSVLASGEAPALVEFRLRGPFGSEPAEAWIGTMEWRETLPMPANPGDWHEYTLQVLGDGTVDLIVDDSLFWRSPKPLERHSGDVRIALGFQSFETRIVHGPVRVYTPPRFELPQVTLTASLHSTH